MAAGPVSRRRFSRIRLVMAVNEWTLRSCEGRPTAAGVVGYLWRGPASDEGIDLWRGKQPWSYGVPPDSNVTARSTEEANDWIVRADRLRAIRWESDGFRMVKINPANVGRCFASRSRRSCRLAQKLIVHRFESVWTVSFYRVWGLLDQLCFTEPHCENRLFFCRSLSLFVLSPSLWRFR